MTEAEFLERCAELGRQMPQSGLLCDMEGAVKIMSALTGLDIMDRNRVPRRVLGRHILYYYFHYNGSPDREIATFFRVSRCNIIHGIHKMEDVLKSPLKIDVPAQILYKTFKNIFENGQ